MTEKPLLTDEKWRRLACCALFTYLWGIGAHLYGLVNGLFSHDSLNALVATQSEEIWKLRLGRFLVPVYRALVRGNLAAPWLIGLIAFGCIALAVYLMSELFRLPSRLGQFLLSGLITTGVTVSALIATYNYELDIDMLSFLLSVLAVWLWQRHKWGFIGGAAVLTLSLALYQAYIAVTLTLCMLLCICLALEGAGSRQLIRQGAKAVAMLLLAGLTYALLLQLVRLVSGISADGGSYNSLTKLKDVFSPQLPGRVLKAWIAGLKRYGRLIPAYSKALQYVLHLSLFGLCGYFMLRGLRALRGNLAAKILLVILTALLPLGMNALYVLDGGIMHALMEMPFSCAYALCLYLLFNERQRGDEKNRSSRGPRLIGTVLLCALLAGNLQTANALYLKKDLEKRATLSYMTRAADRIEAHPGYERGVTPVAVYGVYELGTVPGFEQYASLVGQHSGNAVTIPLRREDFDLYSAYFNEILNLDIAFCSLDKWREIMDSDALRQMPCFPKEGCVGTIDGVLVVKMGERYRMED